MGGSCWALSHVFRACSYSKKTHMGGRWAISSCIRDPQREKPRAVITAAASKPALHLPLLFDQPSIALSAQSMERGDLPAEGSLRIAGQGGECRGEVMTRVPLPRGTRTPLPGNHPSRLCIEVLPAAALWALSFTCCSPHHLYINFPLSKSTA